MKYWCGFFAFRIVAHFAPDIKVSRTDIFGFNASFIKNI